MSKAMRERYSPIRQAAAQAAIDGLETMRTATVKSADFEAQGGAKTATVRCKRLRAKRYRFRKSLELIEEFVERVNGFEPSTLCLASTRSTN